MASHIAQCSCAEIPPSAPVPRRVNMIERTHGSRSDKQIPLQGRRDRICFGRTIQTLRPYGSVGKSFNARNFSDLAVINPIDHLTNAGSRRTLIAHLRGHFVFLRQLGQKTRFIHTMSQWLLHIHVFSHRYSICCYECMGVIGCGNNNGIDAFPHFVVHLTVIVVFLCFWKIFKNTVAIFPVNIGQSNNILTLQIFKVGKTHTSYAHPCNIQFIARCGMPKTFSQYRRRYNGQTCGSHRSRFQKFPS